MFSDLFKQWMYQVPRHLRTKHRDADMSAVAASVRSHFLRGWRAEQTKREYEADLEEHVIRRLKQDREVIVPWIDSVRPILGAKILEIGCGTGSSSVAFAEQGGDVTGIDLDEDALKVARDRTAAYGVACDFRVTNVESFELDKPYDLVIFFACLEHMTVSERLSSLSKLWEQMKEGAHLVVVNTPNRLWWWDAHTAHLPFFNWLPDELAFHYAKLSPRNNLASAYRDLSEETLLHFLRRGRGVSFHEFQLAIGDPWKASVVSSLNTYRRFQRIGRPVDWAFKYVLKKIYPGIHDGWFEPNLNLAIRR